MYQFHIILALFLVFYNRDVYNSMQTCIHSELALKWLNNVAPSYHSWRNINIIIKEQLQGYTKGDRFSS